MERNYDITPVGMVKNARVWNDLYLQNIGKNLDHQFVAVYCLLISVEMYLKAYLILKNKSFSRHEKLRKISHNFNRLNGIIEKTAPKKFSDKVKILFKKYNLMTYDFSVLRYPKAGDMFYFHQDLFNKNHGFSEIFAIIEEEINKADFKKWREKAVRR